MRIDHQLERIGAMLVERLDARYETLVLYSWLGAGLSDEACPVGITGTDRLAKSELTPRRVDRGPLVFLRVLPTRPRKGRAVSA